MRVTNEDSAKGKHKYTHTHTHTHKYIHAKFEVLTIMTFRNGSMSRTLQKIMMIVAAVMIVYYYS